MKKFDRLPLNDRKNEIKLAALKLFNEKGFKATTMENIVEAVSLSKGGVYRIYPSTSSILSDLMIDGMHMRNAYYAKAVSESLKEASLDTDKLINIIVDSLLIYPEYSKVYVEFLWEKKRNQDLETLYQAVCKEAIEDTLKLIQSVNLDIDNITLKHLTNIMNAAILSLHVLDLESDFKDNKAEICAMIKYLLKIQ